MNAGVKAWGLEGVLGVVLLLATASIAAAQPVVRATVREKPPLVVGQQVHIDVQLLVPNFFMSSPRFPIINIPGAVVTLSDDALNLNETIKGEGYAGLQRTYVFVAQAAGDYVVPRDAITFRYAAEPGKPVDASATLPALTLTLDWPAGMTPPADGGAGLVSRVTITQTLDRDTAGLHAGDALTRTITMTAARTHAMFIPPLDFPEQDGVRIYRKDPVLDDDTDSREGLVAGRRTERVVYTFDRPGHYVLPAVDVPWFNIAAKKNETARAPALTVDVAAATTTNAIAPEPPPEAPPPGQQAFDWRAFVPYGIGLAALLLVFALRRALTRIALAIAHGVARVWAAVRRDRATHLPPLNPL